MTKKKNTRLILFCFRPYFDAKEDAENDLQVIEFAFIIIIIMIQQFSVEPKTSN